MKREERFIIRQCQKFGKSEILMAAEKAAAEADIPLDRFLDWVFRDLANKYKEERMNKRLILENEIKSLHLRLPNGTVNKPYKAEIYIPEEILVKIKTLELSGTEELGLEFKHEEGGSFIIVGKPVKCIDAKLKLKFNTIDDESISVIEIPIAFNPNPRELWRNIPSDPDLYAFHKPDSDVDYIRVAVQDKSNSKKDIVAASQRGRSHAQEGKPRDDHFTIFHDNTSDWYVLAVADGAGSAKYSRKGSEIACNTIVEHCQKKLVDNYEFENAILQWVNDKDNEEKRVKVTHGVYDIVFKGAIKAHEAIRKVADANEDYKLKDFATTLMFAICKKYDFGWFIASFWVGDGAMAIYDEKAGTVKLLGKPDEGEFSGQTRFLTMPEIFHDKDVIAKRLRMAVVPDFTALFLMTDGVSDPMFETDKNMNDPKRWEEFYQNLKNGFPEDEIGGVDLVNANEESKNQLLKWLDFWSPGNHDDRTIAILY